MSTHAKKAKPLSRVFDEDARKRFLEALLSSPNVARAAAIVGVHKDTVYEARKRDPKFA
jgi:hypothetical protein